MWHILTCRQLWINDEKELLQEVAGMGELREPWHSKQIQLLDRHLHLLHMYSQAKQNLQNNKDRNFKPSCQKDDRSLEFVPINLHLQRMWVQNDTLRRSGLYDIVTVGAFTSHANKCKTGGLLRCHFIYFKNICPLKSLATPVIFFSSSPIKVVHTRY